MSDFVKALESQLPGVRIRLGEPMSRHTTFRVGGPADYFVEPENTAQLMAVLGLCSSFDMPFYLLGNGSNLLVGDGGYRGVMIALGDAWSGMSVDGNWIHAGAGATLAAAARLACRHALTGLEFAAGIPGTIGGAVVMNAGAYGSEMAAVLRGARVLTPEGKVLALSADQLELGYRKSCILRKHYVVLEVDLELQPGEEKAIRQRMEELAIQRRTKQPLEYPSAGSTFKRPEGYFAGKLIQDAGLRGFAVGGAQVSEKHCGFVINRSGASAADILELCRQVQKRVRQQFGVELELEVRLLGEF